jgi:hypothetical protein
MRHLFTINRPQVLYSLRVLSCASLVPWLSFVLVAPAAACPSATHSAAVAFAVIIIIFVMVLLPVGSFSVMLREFFSEQQESSAFRIRLVKLNEHKCLMSVHTHTRALCRVSAANAQRLVFSRRSRFHWLIGVCERKCAAANLSSSLRLVRDASAGTGGGPLSCRWRARQPS